MMQSAKKTFEKYPTIKRFWADGGCGLNTGPNLDRFSSHTSRKNLYAQLLGPSRITGNDYTFD